MADEEYKEVEDVELEELDMEALFKNRASNKDLVKKVTDMASEYHNRYKTERTYIDDKNKIADYMYACAQNRTLLSSEKTKGMNLEKDTRSNVGSTLFFRQVNQLASQLVNVMQSKPDLWEYAPAITADVDNSAEVGISRINMANALARWTRKQNHFDERMPEFAVSLFKYSNIFIGVRQCREIRMYRDKEPIYEAGEEGESVITGERDIVVQKIEKNYPDFFFPHPDMFWADNNIPDIATQNCVIYGNPRSKAAMWSDYKMGYFDEKQYKEISKQALWSGSQSNSVKENESLNRQDTLDDRNTGMYMQWDCWIRIPVDQKGKWDEEDNPPVLYWATFVGNEIADSVCVRLHRNTDPDDEIPFKEVRCQPDNLNQLYHTHNADIVRSAYSADCTLLNLALDNMALVNEPPLMVIDGAHRIRDFTFRKGQKWHVDRNDAVTQFPVRDNTLATNAIRDSVRMEAMSALATDPAMMGQFAGARTSATEWSGVNQNTRQPHLLQVRYILHQILPWMARKTLRYWDEFGLPEQIIGVTHQEKQYSINPAQAIGNFDVMVNIVDEFQDSMMRQQQIGQIMTMIGNVPFYQQSAHHSTDPSELLKAFFETMKWPASRIILPPDGADAQQVAMSRVNQMLHAGTYVRPQQGENFSVHLRVSQAERLRWKGLEESEDPRLKNLPLLDRYIEEVRNMMSGGQAQGSPNGSIAAGPQNQSEGEAVGNEIAAAAGAAGGA